MPFASEGVHSSKYALFFSLLPEVNASHDGYQQQTTPTNKNQTEFGYTNATHCYFSLSFRKKYRPTPIAANVKPPPQTANNKAIKLILLSFAICHFE